MSRVSFLCLYIHMLRALLAVLHCSEVPAPIVYQILVQGQVARRESLPQTFCQLCVSDINKQNDVVLCCMEIKCAVLRRSEIPLVVKILR